MQTIRRLIASEHPIVRTGLGKLLNGMRDIEVVAEVDLADIVKAALELSPDVLLLELTGAGLIGLRATAALMGGVVNPAVIVLSSNQNPSYVRSILALGVRGYVLRSATHSDLFEAILAVYRGTRYIDPQVSNFVPDMPLGKKTPALRRRQRLSSREAQVLQAVAQGFTTKAIAEQLGVSEKTIQTYRERICDKLELRNRADLVHYVIAHGILNSRDGTS